MMRPERVSPRVLGALLKRLSVPLVASRLTKEEVCLTFGALERMRRSPLHDGEPQQLALDIPYAVKHRVLQQIPVCSAREVGMIAGGCQVMQDDASDLTGMIVEALYQAGQRGAPLGLTELTQVLEAVLVQGCEVFNLTLRTLVFETAPTLVPSVPSSGAALLERFLSAANTYFQRTGVSTPRVQEWYGAMRASCPRMDALTEAVEQNAMKAADLLAGHSVASQATAEAADKDARTQSTERARSVEHERDARRTLFDYLTASAKSQTGATPDGDVNEMMNLFAFFHWHDPVARDGLLAKAQHVLQSGAPTDVERIKRAALLANGTFQRVFELPSARTGSSPASALTDVSATSRAYQMVVKDRMYVPADLLRLVHEEMANSAATDGDVSAANEAMRVYVLQLYARPSLETFTSVAQRLRLAAPPREALEVAALVRCARRDDTELIAAAVEPLLRTVFSCPRNSSIPVVEAASLEDLLALADALAEPFPRSTHVPPALRDTMEAAISAVAVALVQRASANAATPMDRIAVIRRFHALPPTHAFPAASKASAMTEMMCQLLQSVAVSTTSDTLSCALCVAVMQLFSEVDMIYEPLMDRVAAVFARLVDAAASTPQDGAQCDAADLLDMAACALYLDTPELQHAAWRLQNHVVKASPQDTLATETVLAALAVAVSPTGNHDDVCGLVERLAQLPFDSLSPRSVRQALRVLACAGAPLEQQLGHESLPTALVEKVLSQATRAGGDGTLWLDAVVVASYASTGVVACAAATEPVGQLALQHITHCTPQVLVHLCSRAPALMPSRSVGDAPPHWVPALVDALVSALPLQLDHLSFRQIADCVFNLGDTQSAGQRLAHQVMVNHVGDYVINAAEELLWSGRDIARLLRGLSLFQHTGRAIFAVCTARLCLRPVAATLDQPSATLLFAAMGDARFVDATLFNRLSKAYTRHAGDLNAADLYLSVRSHSRVLMRNDDFYKAMGDELARRPGEFSTEAVLDLLAAYATVEQPHDTLADVLGGRLASDLPHLDANQATSALTSLWLMDVDVSTDRHAGALVAHVVSHARELRSDSIVKLCSIMRDLHWRTVPLLEAIAQQSVALHQNEGPSLAAEQSRIVLDTLGMFLIHAPETRLLLTEAARTVSKERTMLLQDDTKDNPSTPALHA